MSEMQSNGTSGPGGAPRKDYSKYLNEYSTKDLLKLSDTACSEAETEKKQGVRVCRTVLILIFLCLLSMFIGYRQGKAKKGTCGQQPEAQEATEAVDSGAESILDPAAFEEFAVFTDSTGSNSETPLEKLNSDEALSDTTPAALLGVHSPVTAYDTTESLVESIAQTIVESMAEPVEESDTPVSEEKPSRGLSESIIEMFEILNPGNNEPLLVDIEP